MTEFTMEAGDLASLIGRVKGIVPSRTTIPILNNVLINVDGRSIHVTANDMDMQAKASAVAETIVPGSITIPAHVLHGVAKALPKSALATIKIEGDRAHFKCGKSKYDFRTLPADEFPVMSGLDPAESTRFSMPVADMMRSLELTRGTFNPDHTQMFYKGLWILIENGVLAFVAADGQRLSRSLDAANGPSDMPASMLPGAAIREIMTLLAASEGDVSVAVSKTRIEIEAGGVSLISRLIEADLPDYQRIIPKFDRPMIEVKASDLSEAVERLMIVYSGIDISKKAPLAVCKSSKGTLGIAGGSHGADYGAETIDATVNEPIEFGASSKALAELVRLWPSTATIGISSRNGGPILLTSADMPSLTQIIMPLRIMHTDRAAIAEAAE
jgi:DNA polymerase-3 subunit beta